MRFQKTSQYATDGQFEGVIVSACELRPGLSLADMEAALSVLERACTPASPRQLTAALAELSLLTKLKAEDGMDSTMRIAAMVPLLSEFPADVALTAIRRRRDGYTFFPAWAELRMSCQVLGSKRLAVRKALRERVEAERAEAA